MSSSFDGIKIAVFGASGFIGRWVARAFTERGARPILVTRNPAAMRQVCREYGIDGDIVEADVCDRDALTALFRDVRPAVVCSLAAYGANRSERDEMLSEQINVRAIETICELTARYRDPSWTGQALIHTGSGLEYGLNGGALSEDQECKPHTVYGHHKLAATRLIEAIASRRSLPVLTARLFTVYGPGEHPGRLLPTLVETAVSGSVAQLSSGLQKRDFTYVEDVAEGICRLVQSACRPGEVVNLATGRLTSVREFAETAREVLGIPRQHIQFGQSSLRPDEMPHRSISIARLQQRTGWAPATSIAEGIRKTGSFLRVAPARAMAET